MTAGWCSKPSRTRKRRRPRNTCRWGSPTSSSISRKRDWNSGAPMSKLQVKAKEGPGRVIHVTPKSAGWTYVGFDLWKLQQGGIAVGNDGDRETCLVFVSGTGAVRAGTTEYGL